MKKLNFTTNVQEDESIICRYMMPARCYKTTVSILYGNDLVHENIFLPNNKDVYVWASHDFFRYYPNKEIKILKDYFGSKGEEETNLVYIHPTKCGGSSIEQTAYEYGVRWGRWSEIKYNYHQTSEHFMNVSGLTEEKILFTSVRNPYNRLISSVYCPYVKVGERRTDKVLNIDEFNFYLKNRIEKEHTLYDFVYYKEKKVIHHILKQENLTNEFNKLMFDYRLDIRMDRKHNSTSTYYSGEKFNVEHINKENLSLINNKFRKDFEYFDYNMITWL